MMTEMWVWVGFLILIVIGAIMFEKG